MEIKCWNFRGAILHCGTNDFAEGASPEEIVDRIAAIINFMQHTHASVRLAVSIILPRPQDKDDTDGGVAKEERRVATNKLIKRMCKQKHVLFANFCNAALTDATISRAWYAKDRLHLNKKGFEALGEYYQGMAASLMDLN
jgi:lysophospholipase L1-like esterase